METTSRRLRIQKYCLDFTNIFLLIYWQILSLQII